MVMLAMGFTDPEENTVFKELEIGQNSRTLLERDSEGRAGKGIYICGDAATGLSLVVRATVDGLAVAETLLADIPGRRRSGRGRHAMAEALAT